MKLKLLERSLCRTPVFSPKDRLEDKWPELKKMIKTASPAFYQIVKDYTSEDLKGLDPKIGFTIWKYFNRARYRPTPFGSFAAFSIVPVSTAAESPIVLNDNFLMHQFIDWKETENHATDTIAQVRTSRWFMTNSTIYKVGEAIRYIRLKNGAFEIASVNCFSQLQTILMLCREKTPPETIYDKMIKEFELKIGEIQDLLLQMISLQLLTTEKNINITGEDFFQRMKLGNMKSITSYLIAERKTYAGGLDKNELYEVQEVIDFLTKQLPTIENRQLNKFRDAFIRKFEHRAIPLMVAMDLEAGIGYGELGGHENDYQLADLLSIQQPSEKEEIQIPYTKLHRFLLDQLTKGAPIRLEEFISNQSASTLPLANTLSVLFHFWQGQPVIENIGGCTANALLGRFTLASTEIESFGQQIAAIEENANPGILFFDVAYQMEKAVDNVNRRKQLYQFELPILTWSCNDTPLNFDDILVTVMRSEIVLWSKKYQKRMVPRIPSAYNYNRSDLAVFRFLCDLQHQGIKSDLNFKLSFLFPNLSNYPRVCYKKVILSPASWLLPDKLLKTIKSGGLDNGKITLNEWLHMEGINFPFKAGHSDQTLCFDPREDSDMHAFLSYCRQQSNYMIYITEALLSDYEVVSGNPSKLHVAQFVASYSHENQVYAPYELIIPKENCHAVGMIPPGDDWLYFEIYCHQARANSILNGRISLLLKQIKGKIRKWFFIRYEDPGPHIRLRIQLKDVGQGYRVIGQLRSLIDLDFKNGLILDIQIKTYFRETDRYGSDRIELVEQLFFHDSKYVLTQLATKKNPETLYASALSMMQHIVTIVFADLNEQMIFVKGMADGFGKELNMNPAIFKKLNQHYRELNDNVNLSGNTLNILPYRLRLAYASVLKGSNSTDRRRLLADLFHMHINRLFNADQRCHEAILYQYLSKILAAKRGRSMILSEY